MVRKKKKARDTKKLAQWREKQEQLNATPSAPAASAGKDEKSAKK